MREVPILLSIMSADTSGLRQAPPERTSLGQSLRALGSDLAWFDPFGTNHSASGFEGDDVIVCSFNNVYKGDPETLTAWCDACLVSGPKILVS